MFGLENKEKQKRIARQELIRRNAVCLFEDGISQEDFEAIALGECQRTENVLDAQVDGPVIQGIMSSQHSFAEWEFKIDFNDYGHITGKYWLWSENDNTEIPEMVAENICEALRYYQPAQGYGQFESQGSVEPEYENSAAYHISFCPYCGSKQYEMNPNFCLACGKKLSSTDNSSTQPNENAGYYNNSSYGTRASAGPGFMPGAGAAAGPESTFETGTAAGSGSTFGTGTAAGSGFMHRAETVAEAASAFVAGIFAGPGSSYGAGASAAARSPERTNKEENASVAITSNTRMLPVTAVEVKCEYCGAPTVVRTFRRFVRCPYCTSKLAFPEFTYKNIDRRSDKYSSVKYWMTCPSCRGENVCLWPSSNRWICQDCGYSIIEAHRLKNVFWFCDDCDTYMNVQTGFKQNTSNTWKCTECGFENDVSTNNIDE